MDTSHQRMLPVTPPVNSIVPSKLQATRNTRLCVPTERTQQLAAFGIPQEYLARRAASTTACALLPIGTPGDTCDAARVSDERLEYHPIRSAPHPHRAIFTTTRQPSAIRAPCNIVDRIGMCAADPSGTRQCPYSTSARFDPGSRWLRSAIRRLYAMR